MSVLFVTWSKASDGSWSADGEDVQCLPSWGGAMQRGVCVFPGGHRALTRGDSQDLLGHSSDFGAVLFHVCVVRFRIIESQNSLC